MSRQSITKGSPHDELSQSKPHEVGVSVSRGVHPEVSEEGDLRRLAPVSGNVLRRLAQRRESEVEEGHLMVDHVHLMLSIPPKYSVADVIGYIKGKSAIHIARNFAGRPRNFVGQHFWARGYFVSTVGRDEQAIRAYIQDQEREDQQSNFGSIQVATRRVASGRAAATFHRPL